MQGGTITMKTLITYKSKTGFAEKYARMIAEELGCSIIPLKQMTAEKMSEYDTVVFGGGIYAGSINGLKKAKAMFEKSTAKDFVVFATGGTPNEAASESVKEMWNVNLGSEAEKIPHFYLQAGISYEKMSFPDKLLMKMFASMLAKKKDKTATEKGFEEYIISSYDISDRSFAEPLIEYLS